jgi:hypothetical protein
MAKQYFLRLLIRDQAEDLVLGVRKDESDRLARILADSQTASNETQFVWLRCLDGKSVAINLAYVQAVRFLWEPVELAPDEVRSEDAVRILFRGRQAPLEDYTEDPDQLFELFNHLELGPDAVAWPKFDDEDGEPLQLNPHEVVWISAPSHLLDEGARMVSEGEGVDARDD